MGALYGYGLEMGGPLQMSLGWPVVTVLTLTIAASMAELCSAYPTSGAMYHWAAALAVLQMRLGAKLENAMGALADLVAIGYGLFACVNLVMPPNALAEKTLAVVRRAFRGPEWARGLKSDTL